MHYSRWECESSRIMGDVFEQHVSSIENGKYNPSLDLAFIISDFFEKPIEDIFIPERKRKNEK